MIGYTPSQDDFYQNEIAHLRAELQRKSDAIQRLWRERDQLRAAAEEARRVLSMPLLMNGDAPVVKALKMLDEALGTSTGALPFDCRTCTRYMARNDCGALIVCVNGSQYVPTNPVQMWSKA